jgi:serine/threonine protein kinase
MDTERNLLFGVVAFQNGTVDADRLAETCAAWVAEPSQPLANMFVSRGLMTDEQKTEVEKVVAHELEAHGGDPQATLAATMDGRSREAIREISAADRALEAHLNLPPQAQSGHVVLGALSPTDEPRERYTLTHLHAKGGMGRVWLARDGALGRQIALKELRPDQADNSIVTSRFLYEAKITAQLEHPGIVPVYELGEGDAPYYTMRFVRGRTLSEATRAYHKKRAAGDADSVAKVELLTAFVNVCHAVAYAHSRGIIHRDLKGQNVVLGDFGEVMVLDWGLAKRVGPDQQADGSEHVEASVADPAPGPVPAPAAVVDDDPLNAVTCDTGASDDDGATLPESHDIRSAMGSNSAPHTNGSFKDGSHPGSNGSSAHRTGGPAGRQTHRESGAGPDGTMQGQLLGTPAYMAPEQAQGRHDLVDERTDVYGLGAILYEILTGRPPFIAPKTSEIIRKVCQEAPTPPRQILAEIPASLEGVCLKALKKASGDRYVTAAELAQEVQRYLADEPVQAYAEPWTSRLSRWARRHKTAVSAAAALLVTATIALGVSTVLVTNEKKEAETQGQQARHAVQLLTKVADIGFDDQLDPLQKEFLEDALQYYEQFTSRVASDPAVKQEHGRVYQQMGDIQRKLGRLPESKKAYSKAMEILEPLANRASAGPEPRRALARTQTLLADLLVRSGADKDQAEPLYSKAVEAQRALATAPTATTDDQLRLGQTLKSQGDLARLNGRLSQGKAMYDQAITVLDQAHIAEPKPSSEIRNELALATDAQGWIYRDLGDLKVAEQDYRKALALLDSLVTDFPTVPRYRESLARVCNSLGLIAESTGRLDDAESHLRRELPLVERLAQDFPDRPEHSRELARTLTNLANVILARSNTDDSEPIFRRAVAVNAAIAAKDPGDVQIRLDLAKCHINLGRFLRLDGHDPLAITEFGEARTILEDLVKASPGKPRYLDTLATCLVNRALTLKAVDGPKVEEIYTTALSIYEKLVKDYPDNADYRAGEAGCLQNLGPVVADAGRPDQAEAMYKKALALLQTRGGAVESAERLRDQAEVLSNLGQLSRPGAEDAFRRSIAVSGRLLDRKPPAIADIHNLAVAQSNLGQLLLDEKRLPEAGTLFAQSVVNFDKLVADAPKTIDYQSHFGYVLAQQALFFERSGTTAEAKTALASAVDHQRQAVKLSKSRSSVRALLASHLLELAHVNLKVGAYKEAATNALELPNTAPSSARDQACFDAARILARLVCQVNADPKVAQSERDQLTRNYLGRTVVLLREAIDTNPNFADRIKADADIKALRSRPEFQTIMNTLVNVGK